MTGGDEPRFLEPATVFWLHRRSLELFGGLNGVRDPGALDSALSSAKNAWHYGNGDAYDVAAAYAFHIAESQAFLDGNKRTAVACALTFLGGCAIPVPRDDGQLYSAMIAIAHRRLDKAGLAELLRKQFPGPAVE
ncbi:type II toxin-antitoxin system death-on-curing family toxin [Horticoccus sp. 23ND18S-11]|uniref:type II toxin-antitoxin system death-on-curing family toxin n=1 Tax=Horticoccus sp. 23ND18S-11 TaxID=3391832 RepID=UPI0039C9B5DD